MTNDKAPETRSPWWYLPRAGQGKTVDSVLLTPAQQEAVRMILSRPLPTVQGGAFAVSPPDDFKNRVCVVHAGPDMGARIHEIMHRNLLLATHHDGGVFQADYESVERNLLANLHGLSDQPLHVPLSVDTGRMSVWEHLYGVKPKPRSTDAQADRFDAPLPNAAHTFARTKPLTRRKSRMSTHPTLLKSHNLAFVAYVTGVSPVAQLAMLTYDVENPGKAVAPHPTPPILAAPAKAKRVRKAVSS